MRTIAVMHRLSNADGASAPPSQCERLDGIAETLAVDDDDEAQRGDLTARAFSSRKAARGRLPRRCLAKGRGVRRCGTGSRLSYDNLTITVIAEFDAPIGQIWELWSDPRKLERWCGPPGYPRNMRLPFHPFREV
jgi:hypothetical protein